MGKIAADYGIISDVGGKDKGNEDSAFYQQNDIIFSPGSPKSKAFNYQTILAMICDGVSGSVKGEEGSTFVIRRLAGKIINHILLEDLALSNIQHKLVQYINETNDDLLKLFNLDIQKGKIPKSTLVGGLILGQYLWIFNLGDSRAYLIRDGQIGQVSIDHVGPINHEITQAFGELKVTPYIYPYLWAFKDQKCTEPNYEKSFYLLICSDGLTDKVSGDEIGKILSDTSKNENLQVKVENLYQLTMSRGIEDNVSIIAVDLIDYIKNLSKIQIIRLKPKE
jgi:protein phosphatase